MQTYEYLAAIVNNHLKGTAVPKRPESISFEEIADIAQRNHLSYMIFSELIKDETCTEEQLTLMRNSIKVNVIRTLIQVNELKNMKAHFEEKGVKNMPLKGSILKYIYPRPELREMSDIDILIGGEDMDKASKVLVDMGYDSGTSVKHHDIFVKKPYMVVEAHRSLYDKSVDNNQYKYFLGFDKAVLSEGYSYSYEYKPEDFYVYMVAHAAKHFYAMGCGIRNLIDVYVYLEKYRDAMDMEYTRSALEKCGIANFAENMEKLAYDWLEGRKLDEFYESLFQYMMDAGIYGKDENGIWNKFADEEKKDISRWELKKWYFFPPLYYMAEYYPWVEDKAYLLPVAWMIRFFRGVFMHKGAKKREMVKTIKNDQILTYKRIYQRMNLKFSSRF